MGAFKYNIDLNIADSTPILTDKSLHIIADKLIARAENLQSGENDQSCLHSGNGYVIDFLFAETGHSYKKVELANIEVFFDQGNEEYKRDYYTESYQETLCELINDQLYVINDAYESEFEDSRLYQEDYY